MIVHPRRVAAKDNLGEPLTAFSYHPAGGLQTNGGRVGNGEFEEWDSFDTLYVPFVWVPDGAPEPTEWLAQHPDAFWVPATLVRGALSIDEDDVVEAGAASADAFTLGNGADVSASAFFDDPRRPASEQAASDDARFSNSHYSREAPIAAYLRINDMFDRMGVGHSPGNQFAGSARASHPRPKHQYMATSGDDLTHEGHAVGLGAGPVPNRRSSRHQAASPVSSTDGDLARHSQSADPNPGSTRLPDVQLAAAGDLTCEGVPGGCQSGGSWGTTAMYGISGRKLCSDCASKLLGVTDEPATDRTIILMPFLLPGEP
ncbi:MAG TPA: hypothetical protein VFW75_10090 [Acetobacteraceae bacterium]|nr:hypothetical protein [Acetobacteraceae bacterium]